MKSSHTAAATFAVIEQVSADLEDSALGHLPSGKFTANATWLTLAALTHNLTRALGARASAFHAKARTGAVRRRPCPPRHGCTHPDLALPRPLALVAGAGEPVDDRRAPPAHLTSWTD